MQVKALKWPVIAKVTINTRNISEMVNKYNLWNKHAIIISWYFKWAIGLFKFNIKDISSKCYLNIHYHCTVHILGIHIVNKLVSTGKCHGVSQRIIDDGERGRDGEARSWATSGENAGRIKTNGTVKRAADWPISADIGEQGTCKNIVTFMTTFKGWTMQPVGHGLCCSNLGRGITPSSFQVCLSILKVIIAVATKNTIRNWITVTVVLTFCGLVAFHVIVAVRPLTVIHYI